MKIFCPVSLGELVDKITILRIKSRYIQDADALEMVSKECKLLMQTYAELSLQGELQDLLSWERELEEINAGLWEIEDKLREKERKKDFSLEFVELARLVYKTNDRRAQIKKRINEKYAPELCEIKSYCEYE